MISRVLKGLAVIMLGIIFLNVITSFSERTALNALSARYVEKGPAELGAPNLITAVIVTYRGLDTLGEVTVLFISAAGVGLLLRRKEDAETAVQRTEASELVKTGSQFLIPMIFLLGVYIFINGHLTPGGGFQGGAVIASGTMLLLLTNPFKKLNHTVMGWLESLAGVGYVITGLLGLVLVGSFLDSRFLSLGTYGEIISAGSIPLIYIIIGLKVGTELSAVLENLKE